MSSPPPSPNAKLERAYTAAKDREKIEIAKSGLQSEAAQGNIAVVLERLLRLDQRVDPRDVPAVYKRALLRFHPDRHVGKPIAKRASYEERFKLVRLAWDNHVARRVGNVVKTSEDGEILEKAEIFDYAQVQRMIAMRKARAAAKLRYEKELRKKRGVVESEDEEDDANKKKKNKKKNRKKKEKPKPESLEAIAKRLAEQEIRDKTRDADGDGDTDDTEAFGESTTSGDDEDGDGNSDTESDFDEKEARRKIESHDELLKLHVKNLQKAEKKNVVESLGTKLARVFSRRNAKDEK